MCIGRGVIQDMICRGTTSHHSGLPLVGYTGAHPWFTIDFGQNIKIKPRCYTLTHSQNWFGVIRDWCFEGSNTGKDWTIIKQHVDDKSLSINNSHTFQIENCEQYYRHFRFYATGRQHHGHWEFTASCIEIYGNLIYNFMPK